ncbi:hypothetical protein RB195_001226 [Necator americanus]|uniref:EGF-like domain-containing protein n=1 Tax=Necator americanus TaxID=51031 RepID=A0ABR1DDD1_NECAM
MEDKAPCASIEEDLPGFIRRKKNSSTLLTSTSLRVRHDIFTIFIMIFLIGRLSMIEGCLPSWFRDDRSDAQALEKNVLEQNEILEPPALLETSHSTVKQDSQETRPPYETNELETDHGDSNESESEELDVLYGTAAPIRVDHKLEEARMRHSKQKCKGWCYRGGNCSVDVDEVTYELRSVNCHCPHGYWGSRCELHFVARLFAPVKGHVEVEKSGVSAFAFIILMVIVSIGLIFYTYRKIARRNTAFNLTATPSLSTHLRRPTVSFQTTPTSVNTTPSSSGTYMSRNASQNYNWRTPFSPLSRSYGHLAVNPRQSSCDSTPSLSIALSRLSLGSTRLLQNLEVPTLKSVSRTSSYPLNNSTNPTPYSLNRAHNESAYYSAMGTWAGDPSISSDDHREEQLFYSEHRN